MKGVVYYYSATGNTKKIAKAIGEGINKVFECMVVSIKKATPTEAMDFDLIGIGAPIWYFREPANVKRFIYQMPNLKGKLGFVFCTHGAMPFGIFFSMCPLLQKRGLTLIGWKDWYGSVEQVLHAVKPYFTDGHPDEIDLEEARKFGQEIAEKAKRIFGGEKGLIPSIPKGKKAPPPFKPYPIKEPFPGAKPERYVDLSSCKYPECKMCIEICPAKAIKLENGKIVFKKNCFNCSLCDRTCPHGAIKLDARTQAIIRTNKIIDMQKCRYPECKICIEHCPMEAIDFSTSPPSFKHNCEGDDLCWVICPTGAIEITNIELTHELMYKRILENKENHPFLKFLEEEEKMGRFRRLVPLEKVGWDNPIYKIKKTPRFLIPDCEE